MPIPNDYREIIFDLKGATDEGRVIWKPRSSGVFVELPDAVIEVWGGDDAESDLGFVSFSLRDKNKTSTGALKQFGNSIDLWFVEEGDDDYGFMLQFLNSARRKAFGIDEKLSSISKMLKDRGVIGKSES